MDKEIDVTKPLQFRFFGKWVDVNQIEFVSGYRYLATFVNPITGEDFTSDFFTSSEYIRNTPETETKPEENSTLRAPRIEDANRKVSKAKRIDFKKPIELYTENNIVACEYVGVVDDISKNFPSWFICKSVWGGEGDEFFLVRGDGKTDLHGDWRVRNKESVRVKLTIGDFTFLDLDVTNGIEIQDCEFTLPDGTSFLIDMTLEPGQ
jgi:hypothetical protein